MEKCLRKVKDRKNKHCATYDAIYFHNPMLMHKFNVLVVPIDRVYTKCVLGNKNRRKKNHFISQSYAYNFNMKLQLNMYTRYRVNPAYVYTIKQIDK